MKYFFEKVNPRHPDKLADRLGGFCVDMAYHLNDDPKIAGEVLLGHGEANIIIENNFLEEAHLTNSTFKEDLGNMADWIKEKTEDIASTTIDLIKARDGKDYWEASEGYLKILKPFVWDTIKRKERFNKGQFYSFTQNLFLWIHKNIPSIKKVNLTLIKQDPILNENANKDRCGDNGIFKGVFTNSAEQILTNTVNDFYKIYASDGKGLINWEEKKGARFSMEINQSQTKGGVDTQTLINMEKTKHDVQLENLIINPLGEWTGGLDVDSGAVNRKLGSDMGRGATGGGLHFKDLSKADVSVNIFCHLLAEQYREDVIASCVIGDSNVKFYIGERTLMHSFKDVKQFALEYIKRIGGFQKLGEWGLIRPKEDEAGESE